MESLSAICAIKSGNCRYRLMSRPRQYEAELRFAGRQARAVGSRGGERPTWW